MEREPAAEVAEHRRLNTDRCEDMLLPLQTADIIAQVLNFGLSSAIDVQISGNNLARDYSIARRLANDMRNIPGVADLRIAEPLDYPAFNVYVDRNKTLELGITGARSRPASSPRWPGPH